MTELYSYGEVGHDPPVHMVRGPWQGPDVVSRRAGRPNVSICRKPLSRVRKTRPGPALLCRECEAIAGESSQPEPIGRDYETRQVRLGDLFVDRSIPLQRPLQEPFANRIAASFSWSRFNENPPKVSARPDGRYHIMDGQHQIEAARRAGYGADTLVTVFVWSGLTRQQEAERFTHNRDRHAVRALDLFNTDVTARQPLAVTVDALLARYGWRAASSGGDGCFAAITHLLRLAAVNEATADRTLAVITGAWGLNGAGANFKIVSCVGKFCLRYPEAEPRLLAKQLSTHRPEEIQGYAAADPEPGYACTARLQGWYNKNFRNPARKLPPP